MQRQAGRLCELGMKIRSGWGFGSETGLRVVGCPFRPRKIYNMSTKGKS